MVVVGKARERRPQRLRPREVEGVGGAAACRVTGLLQSGAEGGVGRHQLRETDQAHRPLLHSYANCTC